MSEEEANKLAQDDEITVLSSVFSPEEFEQDPPHYSLSVSSGDRFITLHFSFPAGYPSKPTSPPTFTLSAPWLNTTTYNKITQCLQEIYRSNPQVIIYTWADWLREHLAEFAPHSEEAGKEDAPSPDEDEPVSEQEEEDIPHIYHGEPVTDRKSKFQAHLAEVQSLEDVGLVVDYLLRDKKIASAAHPAIRAYRFVDPSSSVMHEHRDDDGEAGAADKILFMMEKMECVNILVVVTRWFGGIMLGADRFKHITNVARELIEKTKPLVEAARAQGNGPKSKLLPAEKVFHRIKWDPEQDSRDYIIGYEDRFVGLMEIDFHEFEVKNEIPFHRIKYFRRGDEVIWDRTKRLDKLSSPTVK